MGIKMNVTWKIKVNGKEYGSVDEIPAAEREAYQRAMGQLADAGHGFTLSARSAKIVFNGQEYANIDAMPEDVRQTYLNVMKAVEPKDASPEASAAEAIASAPFRRRIGGPATSRGPRPIAPESSSTRTLVVGAAIIALLAGLYFLVRR